MGEEDNVFDGEVVFLADGRVVGAADGDTVGSAAMVKAVAFTEPATS